MTRFATRSKLRLTGAAATSLTADTLISRLRQRVANTSATAENVTVALTKTCSLVSDVPAGTTTDQMCAALKAGIDAANPGSPGCTVVVGSTTLHAYDHEAWSRLHAVALQSNGVTFTVTQPASTGSLAAPTVDTATVASTLGVSASDVNVGTPTLVDVAADVTVVSSGDETSAAQAAAAQSQALDPTAVASDLGVPTTDVVAQPVTTDAPPSPPPEPAPPGGSPLADTSPSPPAASCFSRTSSLACRVLTPTSAIAAYSACFNGGAVGDAELVAMLKLRAGERVLTLDHTGAPAITRVVLNQHLDDAHVADLLRIETADGAAITVTPDHVLALGGYDAFTAASEAKIGSSLSAGVVAKITNLSGGIINPVTTSATILVADAASPTQPLLASTHPEWSASLFLNTPAFPFVATRLASYLAPYATQAFYSAAEPTIAVALPYMPALAADVSMAALPLVALTDALFAACVVVHTLALPLGVAGALVLVGRAQHK